MSSWCWVYRRVGSCANCSLSDNLSAPVGIDIVGVPPELCPLCQPGFNILQCCGKPMGMMEMVAVCRDCSRRGNPVSTMPAFRPA